MSDLLAIETSGNACSVALGHGTDVLSRHRVAPRQQIELVLPLVEELLAERGVAIPDLAAIAFGRGPGSFTGIRIALSVAQGLALAHDLPVVGVSSLAALAQTAFRQTGHGPFLVAQDARMGEVYWGTYEIKDGLARLVGNEQLSAPDAVRAPVTEDWRPLGSAWSAYNMLPAGPWEQSDLAIDPTPSARDLLALAERQLAEGHAVAAREARPSYLRDQVARRPG